MRYDPEFIAWAKACLHAGDTLAEIAAGECSVLELARMLGVDRPRPKSMQWRVSYRPGGSLPRPWVGKLLKEVVVARHRAGEDLMVIAQEAGVGRSTIYRAVGYVGERA